MGAIKTLFIACSVSLGITAIANAQAISFDGNVISFGDSLSDAGNAFALTGGLSPDPSEFHGSNRYVNLGGLTWIEQLLGGVPNTDGTNATSPQSVFYQQFMTTGIPTVAGYVNLAVGGAYAGSGNLGGGGLPGITEQIQAFAAAGGTIGADDTVTYWAGANNFFAGLPTVADSAGAVALGQNIASLALSDLTQISSGAIIAGGGPGDVIYVNLPNLAHLPSTNASARAAATAAAQNVANLGGDVAAQAAAASQASARVLGAASLATHYYNSTLLTGVRVLDQRDTNTAFTLIDAAAVFDAVIANPAAFGFANVTDGCLLDATCAAADFATQNTYLFADDVHPTYAGYALLAVLAAQTLDPTIGGVQASGLTDAPIQGRQFVAQRALDRGRSFFFEDAQTDLVSTHGTTGGRGAAFVETIAGSFSLAKRGTTPKLDTQLFGLRVGSDFFQSDNFVIGAQASFTTGDGSQPFLDFETNSYAGDIYAASRFHDVFMVASIGAARIDINNIERGVGIGPLTNKGDTEGFQFNILGEVGYEYKIGDYSLIPSGQLGFFYTKLDDYTERGVFAPIKFGEREANVVTGAVNLRIARSFSNASGLKGRIVAGVGYEDFISYDADDLSVEAVTSTAAASTISIHKPDGRGFIFDVGMQMNIAHTFSIEADYAFGYGGNDTQSHRGGLRVISRF